MSEQKRALQSFVAGRHSSYLTQFFRPHAVSSFSSRSEMKKALSLKSLERRLVLPMVERHWQRALEVLSAGYARPARTPEHYQRVIRMMVESEHPIFTHADTTPHLDSNSQRSSMQHTDRNHDFSGSHRSLSSSSSFLVAPLDSLRDKAYAGDIPSNSSLFVTFIWAYCSIGAPFHAVDTFFMCLRRTGLSTASKEHVVGLLLPALSTKGVAYSGCHSFHEEPLSLFSASILHSETSLLDIMLEVLRVAGVPPPRYRCFLAEAAGLDGNWREALRWAPSNPLQLQEDMKTARMHWNVGEEKGWRDDVLKEYPINDGKVEIEEEKWRKRRKEKKAAAVSEMERSHLFSTFPLPLSGRPSLRFDTPNGSASASHLPVSTGKSVAGAVQWGRFWPIHALATLLSPSALENVLCSVLEEAAEEGEKVEMIAQCTSLETCEEEGAGPCLSSSCPLSLASALVVARVLWNAVFPYRANFSLSLELLCAMMNVLGVISVTMTATATTTRSSPPRSTRSRTAIHDGNPFYACGEDLWKEIVYWFVHFFLCPRHVLLRLMGSTMVRKEREPHRENDGCSPFPSASPSTLPFFPVYMQRYIPSTSSADVEAFPFWDRYASSTRSKEEKEEDSTLFSPFSFGASTTTFPSHASLPRHRNGCRPSLPPTSSSPFQTENGLPYFFCFHFPSPSQLPRRHVREAEGTEFPFRASSDSFSSPSFPLTTVALHMAFAAYPMMVPWKSFGSFSHYTNAVTSSALDRCGTSPPPPSAATKSTTGEEANTKGKVKEKKKNEEDHEWIAVNKDTVEKEEETIHTEGQRGADVATLPFGVTTSKHLEKMWLQNPSLSFSPRPDNDDATGTNTPHAFCSSGDCPTIHTTHASTPTLPLHLNPFTFPTVAHPREIVLLLDDLLLHAGNMKITPFMMSRVAPALLQLGQAERATRLLEEVLQKEFQQEREISEFCRFSPTSRSQGRRKRRGGGEDSVDHVAKRHLQRTLFDILSTARECAGSHQRLDRSEVQRECLLRRNTNLEDKIMCSSSSTFSRVCSDVQSKSETYFSLSRSVSSTRAPVMAREREERHDSLQKEQFLQKFYNLQGRNVSFSSSPFNPKYRMVARRPPSWHPDTSAEKDPLPPPIGLHDKASGWNYVGRGGEKAFFNSRRTPHPFSSWPKVMRSLADPYRGWNPRVNSSLGHRENVKKWNGRSSV